MYILLINFIWDILLIDAIYIGARKKIIIVLGLKFISCYIIYFIQNFIGGIIWLILMNLWILLTDFVIRKM